jgi:N-acyl-D-aspartate/D-glutamate deacylase
VTGPEGKPFVIAGGLVVDGTGHPAREADVLLVAGRVAEIGAVETPPGADTIDARDRVVTPGFVDVHSHADFTLLAFPDAESAVRQGITTVVVGNCGCGVAPVEPADDVTRVAARPGLVHEHARPCPPGAPSAGRL